MGREPTGCMSHRPTTKDTKGQEVAGEYYIATALYKRRRHKHEVERKRGRGELANKLSKNIGCMMGCMAGSSMLCDRIRVVVYRCGIVDL